MKKNLIIIFLFFLTSCGYAPMYSSENNTNFKISIIENNGDRDINNLINQNLKRYSNENSNDNLDIKINSVYGKNSIAKDTTGNTTDYEIKISTIFQIKTDNIEKEIIISENFTFKSLSSNFEELEYEKTVKENMVRNIIQKFILQLSRLK